MTLQELIHNYLITIRQRGLDRIAVDEDARTILRGWMLAARQGKQHQPAPSMQPTANSTPRPPETAGPETSNHPPTPAAPRQPNTGEPISAIILPAAPPATGTPPEQEDIPFFRIPGSTPAELWQQMERQLPTWPPLQNLGTLRRTAVMGSGNRRADIMFIGDAPGYYDERAGQPFQGEAGKKLDGMLTAMGLTREQVYITHLVKFRPALPHQTTNNRAPSTKEILFSRSIIELEIRLVAPKVIVALGVVAARGLLQRGDLPLAAYQEQHGNYGNIPVIVTHHPSYLLRTSDLGERRRLWEEMLGVMQLAGLPISDKQRGYFLPKTAKI